MSRTGRIKGVSWHADWDHGGVAQRRRPSNTNPSVSEDLSPRSVGIEDLADASGCAGARHGRRILPAPQPHRKLDRSPGTPPVPQRPGRFHFFTNLATRRVLPNID
jgi:hypothetical protein